MKHEEAYIRQLKRALSVPRRRRREILRDVRELLDTAAEYGETEEVLRRLGPAAAFAENLDVPRRAGAGKLIGAGLLLLAAAICFGIFLLSRIPFYPPDAIGHMEAATPITLISGFDPLWLLLLWGAVCLAAAIVLGIRFIRSKK